MGIPAACARLMRFDFHFTPDGWRISEVNSDVPGGIERIFRFRAVDGRALPAMAYDRRSRGRLCSTHCGRGAGRRTSRPRSRHGVHRRSPDDAGHCARARGMRTSRASGEPRARAMAWRPGMAGGELVAGVARSTRPLLPAEWMPALPSHTGWAHWFRGSRTPLSNPATAILTQHKRFPLVWDHLRTPLPTWRALLPETRSPRAVRWSGSDEWVLKPGSGRAGDGIGVVGLTAPREMSRIARQARWWPRGFVAQRRFEVVPVAVGGESVFPCLGVCTLDGRVIGAYGRVASHPLIDANAADAAVLAA